MRISRLLAVLALIGGNGFAQQDALYQLSTIPALKAGVFEGFKPYSEIKPHGDFGIGTFDGLNGEMIELDGTVYQVRADGSVHAMPDTATTPYVTVTFFETNRVVAVESPMDYEALQQKVDAALPTLNIPYAIRVEGEFEYVKARSVPAQSKPYPPLEDAVRQQTVFELTNVTGTAVGFRFPPSFSGVQAPGYHLHFLTTARDAGGHLLEFRVRRATVAADDTHRFELDLPEGGDFYALPPP